MFTYNFVFVQEVEEPKKQKTEGDGAEQSAEETNGEKKEEAVAAE